MPGSMSPKEQQQFALGDALKMDASLDALLADDTCWGSESLEDLLQELGGSDADTAAFHPHISTPPAGDTCGARHGRCEPIGPQQQPQQRQQLWWQLPWFGPGDTCWPDSPAAGAVPRRCQGWPAHP